MSLFRMNRQEEARAALEKGVQIEQTQLPKLDGGDLGAGWFWRDRVIARELTREALALIEPSSTSLR